MAWRTMGALLVGVVLAQFASIWLAQYYAHRLEGIAPGSITSDQWHAYTSQPKAPDVLFIGDSRAFTDVVTATLDDELTTRFQRHITVGKLAINGADAAVLDALVYRVMQRPSRPRLIVYSLAEFQFNASYARDFTSDYWEISDPLDPGFLAQALRLDPYRARLLIGTLLPTYANLPVIMQGVACDLKRFQDLRSCDFGGAQDPAEFRADYLRSYMHDFHYSDLQDGYLGEAVDRAHAGGTRIALIVFPIDGLDAADATDYETFRDRTTAFADSRNLMRLDLHAAVPDGAGMWSDLLHLSPTGAATIQTQLTDYCAALLSGSS